jgi:hypothetical protein
MVKEWNGWERYVGEGKERGGDKNVLRDIQ